MVNAMVILQQMAAVCNPTGKLILLEHGKASWDWLNSSLDKGAQEHFAKWGCWWNRDILQLVKEVGYARAQYLALMLRTYCLASVKCMA